MYAIKDDKQVCAWELGAGTEMEKKMILYKRIVSHPDGVYELFSQEALKEKGETAHTGDFFKVDDSGFPYPIKRSWFLQNHKHLKDDMYQQISKPIKIWRYGEAISEEIQFLLDKGLLSFHPEDPKHYYSAFIWGTEENAADDAIIALFDVERAKGGIITDINFNFIEKEYFEAHYDVL